MKEEERYVRPGGSTLAALIAYCSIVLGSLMTDFGKASKVEANIRIALYKKDRAGAELVRTWRVVFTMAVPCFHTGS